MTGDRRSRRPSWWPIGRTGGPAEPGPVAVAEPGTPMPSSAPDGPRASATPSVPRLHSACYAPHSALYFEPDGSIRACCSSGFTLGRVTGPERESLAEIWAGANLAAQRQALERDSYAYACQECEVAEASGGRSAALAAHFDRFADGAPHPHPKLLDFALSNRCNLQCVMCHGGLSSSIRTQREGRPPLPAAYDDAFFAELETFLPHAARLQFKGGEPFLARENRRIWDFLLERGLRPEISVTTNGTIFNDNVARYARELAVHPIISIDGMQAHTLESIRVGVDAPVLWANVDRFQAIAEASGNGMTLSFCFMADNWREALPFLQEVDRRGVNGNLILVNHPRRHDVLRLPLAELTEVHRSLAYLPTAFRNPELERAWREVLDRLRAQVEQPVELTVRGGSTPAPPVGSPRRLDPAAVAERHARLRARHHHPPLVVHLLDDDTIVDVEDVAWAAHLDAEAWRGRSFEELEHLISEHTGEFAADWAPSPEADVEHYVLTFAVEADLDRLAIFVHFTADGGRRVLMFPLSGREAT